MILTFTGENVGTLCHVGGYMESDIKYALSILSLGYSKNTLKGITHKYPKGDPLMWGGGWVERFEGITCRDDQLYYHVTTWSVDMKLPR